MASGARGGSAKFSVLKSERVLGETPRELIRVKVSIRQETFKNHGGGTRWGTTGAVEPIVIQGFTIEEIDKAITELLTGLSKRVTT